ncbi:MAG: FprA family A-type flavoprotein [Firmicutes bacterium]|nr:FprA family A-type flavoprotein [Bacillota bacterium]
MGDRRLRFISAPFLHWPDTIFTYLEEEQVLFTCDGFGAHYCDPKGRMWASAIGGHMDQVRYYYDSIMSPFKPKILDAMERIKGLPMRLIAPGHGPILDEDLWSYVDAYQRWSSDEAEGEKRIVIAYASAYGHTRRMAEGILEGVQSVPEVTAILVDVSEMTDEEMDTLLTDIDGLIVGSPTFNADAVAPIWRLLSHINPIKHKGILAGAFGNYGWSGEAVELLEKKMHSAKLALVQPGMRINFAPTAEELAALKEWGRDFATAMVREPTAKS